MLRPFVLPGKNMVIYFHTGSKKTCTFMLASLVHAKKPTKRLGLRTVQSCRFFALRDNCQKICLWWLKSLRVFSRVQHNLCHWKVARFDQIQDVAEGEPESLLATPARLIDFIHSENMVVMRVSHLVLYEADQTLDLGLEPQIRKKWDNISFRGQTLMPNVT